MPQTIFLTGATGFVGRSVLGALLDRGNAVSTLCHSKPVEGLPPDQAARVRSTVGGLFDDAALRAAVAGCSAAVHLVGIIEEHPDRGETFERIHVQGTRAVLGAVKDARIRRYVHMSALGTRPDAASQYHRTKWRAEEFVRESGLEFTIFRPSMIHGPGGDFMQQVAAWARGDKLPYFFMPYFGSGIIGHAPAGKIQPVRVDEVATAFADAVTTDAAVGKTYALAGQSVVDWPTFMRTASLLITGKEKLTVGLPAWYAKLITRIAPASWLPFNRDQVIMTQEDVTADTTPAATDLNWHAAALIPAMREYAAEMGRKKAVES